MSIGEILSYFTGLRFSRKYFPISTPSAVYNSEASSVLGFSSFSKLGEAPNRKRKLISTRKRYTIKPIIPKPKALQRPEASFWYLFNGLLVLGFLGSDIVKKSVRHQIHLPGRDRKNFTNINV